MSSPKVDPATSAVRRQRRNQGFTDGLAGRKRPRTPASPDYMHSYVRGQEAREKVDG